MTPSSVGRSIVDSHVNKSPGVVHGCFEPLDVNCHLLGLGPQFHGRSSNSVGQHVAKSLTLRNLVHQLQNGFGVAPFELQTAGLLSSQQALLVSLHGQGDGRSRGDRVHAMAVTQVIRLDDSLKVVVQKQGSKGCQGLVLWPMALKPGRRAFSDLDLLAAGDGAGKAAIVLIEHSSH